MEGIRRSKLVFAGGHEGLETVPIKDLKRVREPVSRSKSGVQGKVADVLHGRSRHAESQNEIKAFRILAATARADAWQEQPFLLEYHLEGKRHRYTPDVLVAWGSHQEVIEIKEDLERQAQRAICVGGRAVVAAQIPNRSASENLALRHQIGVLPFRDDDPKLLAARALANYS